MKKDTRHQLGLGKAVQLGIRIIAMTGPLLAVVGVMMLLPILKTWSVEIIWQGATGQEVGVDQPKTLKYGAIILLAGLGISAFGLLMELLAGLFGSARRSLAGVNSTLQLVLMLGVVLGINFLAFSYPKRWDLTRTQDFTLPKLVTQELKQLKGQTSIIVLQQHKTFGRLSTKPDVYDYDAERQVISKVRDVVDQFRQFGPQFKVITLDVEAIGYDGLLKNVTATRPGLSEAIAAAPENSIFFYPEDRVELITQAEATQRLADGRKIHTLPSVGTKPGVLSFEGNIPRMSFNEFYQLDKTASKAANPDENNNPRGNLVLRPQGIEAFAKRVIAIQEKKPKVALMVIHEWLTSGLSDGGQEQFSAHGLRKSLEDHGFEVVDVLLKRWPPREEPTPAAYNIEETEFDRLAAELDNLDDDLRTYREEQEQATAFRKLFSELPLAELNQKFRTRVRTEIDEDFRKRQLRSVDDALKRIAERLAELTKERQEVDTKVQALLKKDRAFEDRRVSDVKAKMTRLVNDCDLLIIPRHTIINNVNRQMIDSAIYRLSKDQVDVVKNFMASGKPVLACLGPNNEPQGNGGQEPLDEFERLLGDVGLELGRQTVLFDAEAKGLASRQAGNLLGGAPTDIPSVSFPTAAGDKKPNPISKAMQAIANSANQSLEIRIRHPRPIYLQPDVLAKATIAPDFLQTAAAAWNEEQPFPAMRQVGPREVVLSPPQFQATPFDDPKRGTRDEERRGPFPIAVALEAPIPLEWYDQYAEVPSQRVAAASLIPLDFGLTASLVTASNMVEKDRRTLGLIPQQERKTTRLAVIGHGGLFTGKELSPAHEQLLLHSCNWLLKREDRLPRTDSTWSYPRTEMPETTRTMWQWGTLIGPAIFFLYVGAVVLLLRRVR